MRRETPAAAFKLTVSDAVDDKGNQFQVNNQHRRLEDWDCEYVSFGGFFGVHGPQMFAMAPEILEHLEFAVKLLEGFAPLRGMAQVSAMREAVTKARGK